jgi:hypothetical protein
MNPLARLLAKVVERAIMTSISIEHLHEHF